MGGSICGYSVSLEVGDLWVLVGFVMAVLCDWAFRGAD